MCKLRGCWWMRFTPSMFRSRCSLLQKYDFLSFFLTHCAEKKMHVQRYPYNKIFCGAWIFHQNDQKCWQWLATFKTLTEREIIDSNNPVVLYCGLGVSQQCILFHIAHYEYVSYLSQIFQLGAKSDVLNSQVWYKTWWGSTTTDNHCVSILLS